MLHLNVAIARFKSKKDFYLKLFWLSWLVDGLFFVSLQAEKFAQSQRNVSAFKLVKNCENKSTTTFNAFEAYLKDGRETYREVLIKVTKLENKNYLLEYFGKDKDREYNSNERYNIKLID